MMGPLDISFQAKLAVSGSISLTSLLLPQDQFHLPERGLISIITHSMNREPCHFCCSPGFAVSPQTASAILSAAKYLWARDLKNPRPLRCPASKRGFAPSRSLCLHCRGPIQCDLTVNAGPLCQGHLELHRKKNALGRVRHRR
jgi:hypothetical protein